jgi:hypothetical protein
MLMCYFLWSGRRWKVSAHAPDIQSTAVSWTFTHMQATQHKNIPSSRDPRSIPLKIDYPKDFGHPQADTAEVLTNSMTVSQPRWNSKSLITHPPQIPARKSWSLICKRRPSEMQQGGISLSAKSLTDNSQHFHTLEVTTAFVRIQPKTALRGKQNCV